MEIRASQSLESLALAPLGSSSGPTSSAVYLFLLNPSWGIQTLNVWISCALDRSSIVGIPLSSLFRLSAALPCRRSFLYVTEMSTFAVRLWMLMKLWQVAASFCCRNKINLQSHWRKYLVTRSYKLIQKFRSGSNFLWTLNLVAVMMIKFWNYFFRGTIFIHLLRGSLKIMKLEKATVDSIGGLCTLKPSVVSGSLGRRSNPHCSRWRHSVTDPVARRIHGCQLLSLYDMMLSAYVVSSLTSLCLAYSPLTFEAEADLNV